MAESTALMEQAETLAESARDSRRRMDERWQRAEVRLTAQADEASKLEAERQAGRDRVRRFSLWWIAGVLGLAAAVALLWPDAQTFLLFGLVVAASVPGITARYGPRAGDR
jgi:Flp pilus assembly protein TadB